MKHLIAILGFTGSLLLGSCSSVSPAPNDVAVPTPTSSVPTSTIASVDSTTTTTPELSRLADLVIPLGSAQYDPADHIDDRAVPVSITIEGVGITAAPVIDVGIEDNGDMEIPDADGVGWYRFNPTPGQPGSAVLAAHIAFGGKPGVFRDLGEASVGDRVVIQFDDGTTNEFEIVELAQYQKQELPTDRVFAKTGDPVLTLITCGGDFNRSLRSYEDNIVAYAIPIDG